MSDLDSLLSESQPVCAAHQCPQCGTQEQVTAERVVEGSLVITRCHCRACGHSWHPQVDSEAV